MATQKEELLAEAKELGVETQASDTVAELQAKIEKAKADDQEDKNSAQREREAAQKQQREAAAARRGRPQANLSSSSSSQTDGDASADDGPVATGDPAAPSVVQGPTGRSYALGQNETADPEAIEAAEELDVDSLPRSALMMVKQLVDGALNKRGLEPRRPGPTQAELVAAYPYNHKAGDKLDYAAVAKKVSKAEGREFGEDDIAGFAVRQRRRGEEFVGPQFVVVVDHSGRKHTVEV